MELVTESYESTDKVLIISKSEGPFLSLLTEKITELHAEITFKKTLPDDYEEYDVCFFINDPKILPTQLAHSTGTKFIFIFFDAEDIDQTYSSFAYDHHLKHFKIILIQTYPQFYLKDIETLLWFAFSSTADIFLHIYHQDTKPHPKK